MTWVIFGVIIALLVIISSMISVRIVVRKLRRETILFLVVSTRSRILQIRIVVPQVTIGRI